jgi:hypothetical protein
MATFSDGTNKYLAIACETKIIFYQAALGGVAYNRVDDWDLSEITLTNPDDGLNPYSETTTFSGARGITYASTDANNPVFAIMDSGNDRIIFIKKFD